LVGDAVTFEGTAITESIRLNIKGTREKTYGLGTPFNNFIPRARFLFGPEVEAYLSDAADKWARLRGLEGVVDEGAPRAPERAEELSNLRDWFASQSDTGVKELFAPYLNFEKWR
jgi:hypothetical protein